MNTLDVEVETTTVEPGQMHSCADFIATISAKQMPDNDNVQLCVLSAGFDAEAVVAQLSQRNRKDGNRPLHCVVVPESLPPGTVKRLAAAIEWHLHRIRSDTSLSAEVNRAGLEQPTDALGGRNMVSPLPPPLVIAMEEGTGTKDRCAAYQRGAIVLLSPRSLCADLLHRRLAVELVGMAILFLPFTFLGRAKLGGALIPQMAFCAELLLRSGRPTSVHTHQDRSTPPPIVILSDAPLLMRSLVQQHHIGAERFVQQLHVGDLQLFPRFRLAFVRHFEAMSAGDAVGSRRLAVDRVVAPVAPSVLALDGLLAKIVLETLQELQRLEQQQHRFYSRSGNTEEGGEGGERRWSAGVLRAAAAAEADEDVGAERFLPRARLTSQTVNGHLDYSAHPRSRPPFVAATPSSSAGPTAYVRHGWRAYKEGQDIVFAGISETAALSVDYSDLDTDLRAAVRRYGAQWPYRLLTESLIDVRRLRRSTRSTAYGFLLQLDSVLEKRLPRHSVYGTGVRPPAALWTLSSHFNDVVTVATHRIGTVVYARPSTTAAPVTPNTISTPQSSAEAVVIVDSSDEEESEQEPRNVSGVSDDASGRGATAVCTPRLIPNAEEQEADMEVAVRLVLSWCRTALRRQSAQQAAASGTASNDRSVPGSHGGGTSEVEKFSCTTTTTTASAVNCATLLILAFGSNCVSRYTERLTHDLATYQQLQLHHFMHLYRSKYGIALQTYGGDTAAAEEGDVAALVRESKDPNDTSSDEDGVMEEPGSPGNGASVQRERPVLFGDGGSAADDASGVGALHQALLSQPPPSAGTPTSVAHPQGQQQQSSSDRGNALTLMVERVKAGSVTLCPFMGVNHIPAGSVPRVLIMDGAQLSAAELAMLLEGSHAALAFNPPSLEAAPPARVTGGDKDNSNTASIIATEQRCSLCVERIVLCRHQLITLRQLEMAQDLLPTASLRRLKVQLITTTLGEVDFKKSVAAERVAFEGLAHAKATLTGTLLVDQSSLRQTEEALESGMQVSRRRMGRRRGSTAAMFSYNFTRGVDAARPAVPCIIFDEREFRSTLPYDLYKRGMELVPLTLSTADYVLSSAYAVERKSVGDYLQSVTSGRIQHQLAALSRRYTHPMCLIEFDRGLPFRLLHSTIYGRTARLMAGYPRVSFLWARSPPHAAGMLVQLKKSVAVDNPDPSDPSLTGSAVEPNSAAEATGLAAMAAERETAHYAARVLSKFTGITHRNAPRVMQLCGSLVGLATISQASLATVMGTEEAGKLYTFLHAPFHERVD